jgi:chromosome segregation ATPase
MERAIEFLVKNQASFDVRLEQTNQQIAEVGGQLRDYARTQSQFIQIVTESITGLAENMTKLAEAQARTERMIAESNAQLNAKIAELNAKIAESNARLDEKIADTNARLDRLAATVERNITGGNGVS